MKQALYFFLLPLVLLASSLSSLPLSAQAGRWCGYGLIEGVPGIGDSLTVLGLLTPDENPLTNPFQLFQSRVSLDGTKAIIEGCWKIFPTRSIVVNLLALSGLDASEVDQELTYSLFAPGASDEDSAASVRQYLSEHILDWESQEI